jgi:predicted RNA binding protein with dsRBD fold (UPF0201 family)
LKNGRSQKERSLRVRLTLSGHVSPSEDPEKVLAAMRNVLGDCDYAVEKGEEEIRLVSVDGRCLKRLRDQLRDRHVRAAARRLAEESRAGTSALLMVNRQAALAGVIALCGSESESPLGPLYLKIESDELDVVIDWLTSYETE